MAQCDGGCDVRREGHDADCPLSLYGPDETASGGNPIVVIHEGDTICEQFIDQFLEGYNVTLTSDGVEVPIYVTGHDTDPGDGFPLIVGYRLDEDFNFDENSERICIHWQTITRIEVW